MKGPDDNLYKRPDYVFNDLVTQQMEFSSDTTPNGRYYSIPAHGNLPSVTTVLGASKSLADKESLQKWKDSVGEDEANRIVRAAAKRGTALHLLCENYFLDNGKFQLPKYNSNHYRLWEQMHPLLQRVDNIHCMEGVLYSKRLGIAGRVDLVAEFDGELSIIDFKTTRSEKQEEWIEDYFIQTCMYALMYSEMYGVKVKKVVILMAQDSKIDKFDGKVYVKDTKDYVSKVLDRIAHYKAGKRVAS